MKFVSRSAVRSLAWRLARLGSYSCLAAGLHAQCVAEPQDMTHWWRADNHAVDWRGAAAASLSATVAYTAGRVGQAFSFDADADLITVPHRAAMNLSPSGFSVELWVNAGTSQPNASWAIVDKSHGFTDSTGWAIAGGTDGRVGFAAGQGGSGSGNFVGVSSTASILDGGWHHVATTWDGAMLRLYLDGVLDASVPMTAAVNNSRPLRFGHASGSGNVTPTRFFRGAVDEISLYRRALSAAEISVVHAAGSSGKCPGERRYPGLGIVLVCTLPVTSTSCNTHGWAKATIDPVSGIATIAGDHPEMPSAIGWYEGAPGSTSPGVLIGPVTIGYRTKDFCRRWTFGATLTLTPGQVDHALAGNTYLQLMAGSLSTRGQFELNPKVSWVSLLTSGPKPNARQLHSLEYDSFRGVAVLFGGRNFFVPAFDDTWEFNGQSSLWVQRVVSPRPPARRAHAACFDDLRGRMVVFGGEMASGPYLGDTWEWDGTSWHDRSPATSPSPRSGMAMTFQAHTGTVIMFGGRNASGPLDDTWEWNGVTWTDRSRLTRPTARALHTLKYDPIRQKAVLFGGSGPLDSLGDTWEFDGVDWEEFPAPVSPGSLSEHVMTFDPEKQRLILVGGRRDDLGLNDEVWEWNGVWTRSASAATPVRAGMAFAYDPVRQRAIAFGGTLEDGSEADDEAVEVQNTAETGLASTLVAAGTRPTDVATADLDRDGGADLVTANESAPEVTMLRNDGSGGLTAFPLDIAGSNFSARAIVGLDADNDGHRDDLAVVGGGNDFALVTDAFDAGPPTTLRTTTGFGPVHVAAGDLDADPRDDVVVACEGYVFPLGQSVEVYRNGGTLSQSLALPAGVRPRCVELCDVDRDGDKDIAVLVRGATDAVLLFCNDSTGTFGVVAGQVNLQCSGLAAGLVSGDFDGDGDVDLATTESTVFPPPGTVDTVVLRHAGSGLTAGDFTVTRTPTDGSVAVDLAFGEIDGDTIRDSAPRRDFVVVHGASTSVVAQYGFDSQQSAFKQQGSVSSYGLPVAATVADLNGDGRGDVAVANWGSNSVSLSLARAKAAARRYGNGSPGTGGRTPKLHVTGALALDGIARIRAINTRPLAPCIALVGSTSADIDLGNGNRLYLGDVLFTSLSFADADGRAGLDIRVPNVPSLRDAVLNTQWVVFDPQGAFNGQLALTDAMRLVVGD